MVQQVCHFVCNFFCCCWGKVWLPSVGVTGIGHPVQYLLLKIHWGLVFVSGVWCTRSLAQREAVCSYLLLWTWVSEWYSQNMAFTQPMQLLPCRLQTVPGWVEGDLVCHMIRSFIWGEGLGCLCSGEGFSEVIRAAPWEVSVPLSPFPISST